MDAKPRNRALLSAVERGDVEKFGELVDGDDLLLRMSTPFGTWLHIAACEGQLRMVEHLMKRGLDLNAYGGIFKGGVLNAAASKGHTDVVEFLLSKGAKLDVSEPEKILYSVPFMLATRKSCFCCLRQELTPRSNTLMRV